MTELPYHWLQRHGRHGWMWSLIGIAIVLASMLIVSNLLLLGVTTIGVAIAKHGQGVGYEMNRLLSIDPLTPSALAYVDLGLAAAIPVTMLVTRYLHGLPGAWLVSVVRRIRWRWLARCFGYAAITLVITMFIAQLLPNHAQGTDLAASPHHWTGTSTAFLIVILLLTPLQAAGEEFAFRGYLTQAVGAVFTSKWVAIVVPALIFAIAHGIGQDWPVFIDRLAFGLIAGWLVIRTGGVEAGLAMHTMNNLVAFLAALIFGDLTNTLTVTSGSAWDLVSTASQSLIYLGLCMLNLRKLEGSSASV